jgi:hypothetical protein
VASTRIQGVGASGTSTTPQVTLGAGPTQGNLLIAWIATNGAGTVGRTTITAANGYAILTVSLVSGVATDPCALAWKIAGAGESTTQNPGTTVSGPWSCRVVEYNNPNGWPVSPVDTELSQSVASTASYTTPSRTPTASLADCVVAAGYGCVNTARTWSVEAFSGSNVGAVTEDGDAAGGAIATAAITSTTGAYQGSATCSAATGGADGIAIFTPNVAAGGAVQQMLMMLGVGV